MSEKELLDLEGLSHIEQLDKIIESRINKAVEPMIKSQNLFLKIVSVFTLLAASVVGYIFIRQENISESLAGKATKTELSDAVKERERDYLMKLDYYKMEEDEHRDIREAFQFPERATFILDQINSNMRREMGFNYSTSRSAAK